VIRTLGQSTDSYSPRAPMEAPLPLRLLYQLSIGTALKYPQICIKKQRHTSYFCSLLEGKELVRFGWMPWKMSYEDVTYVLEDLELPDGDLHESKHIF
jgi:hypothetical protein